MKMHLNDGKRDVEDVEVSLKEALGEIGKHPPCSEEVDSFIGFTRNEEEICQFVRFGEDDWLIDVPINEKGECCKYTMQADHLTTSAVREVLIRFFGGGEKWKDGLKLHRNWLGFWNRGTIIDASWLAIGAFLLFVITYVVHLPPVAFYIALGLDALVLILSVHLFIDDVWVWLEERGK